jgi:tRNA-splicing ligase RtcB
VRGAASHAPLADFSRACPPEARRFVERVRAIPDVAAVAVYPDVHLGGDPAGEPSCVGTAIATRSRLVPAWLGSDLGCGVAAVRLARSSEALRDATRARRALATIARAIPIQRHAHPLAPDLDPLDGEIVERALGRGASAHELGTLGRGNHFVELREARDDGALWWLAHTGSRSFGPHLQATHRARASERAGGFAVIEAHAEAGARYLGDVACAVSWARVNRRVVLARVLDALGDVLALDPDLEGAIDTCHDSLTHERHTLGGHEELLFVHRKGAMQLAPGERGLVPGSMGTDVAIVRARPDAPGGALGSSAHGAGRAIPRSRASRRFDVGDLADSMRGVLFDARLARGLLDEIPLAYKDLDDVLRAERALVRPEARLAPLLVHKGTG